MQELFFELIRVSIGNIDRLSRVPTVKEWQTIYDVAERQSLIGVCFSGLQRIGANSDDGFKNVGMSEVQYLTWMGMAVKIHQRNETLDKQCVDIQKRIKKDGFETCILKGQGVACCYNENLRMLRQSGDIDIWVNGTWRDVMDYVNAQTPNREFDMKHTHLNVYDGTTVEVHWWPSTTSNFFLNRRLRCFYRDQAAIQFHNEVPLITGETITITTPFFNSIHVLLHIWGHFLYEGVGFRQIMDYYFVCIQNDVQSRKEEVVSYYKKFGLYDFSRSVMWILQDIFGMDSRYLLTEPDEKGGQELLREILEGGNFGHASIENQVMNETIIHRWQRRAKRKLRLLKYNPMCCLCAPFYKTYLMVWKYNIIKQYNL